MLFNFLKYLQPTHYFGVYKNNGASVFPIFEKLPESIQNQLIKDDVFRSEQAKKYDLSWQAIQKGYIGKTETYTSFEKLPLTDEYSFIRKYFNPIWASYVLGLRILSFKNPIKEIQAWYKARFVKRSSYLVQPIAYKSWDTFESTLLKENPKVTVVIPTLNRYEYLKDVLEDLEKQDYNNFEVIVVDQSEPFQEEFYTNYALDLKVFYQKEKALWLARNTAIRKSEGDLLLLFDDDSRIEKDWIQQHI